MKVRTHLRQVGNLLFAAALTGSLSCNLLQAQRRARTPRAQQQQRLPADKLLSLGDFYFKNNDTTDAANTYYQQVVKDYPNTREAGFAQYNRGSYWQRKYYILKEKFGTDERKALDEAEGQYYDFIDKFAFQTGTMGLLADAEFNLALVYLQKDKREIAVGWLNRMLSSAVDRDKTVYMHRVVWSSKSEDVLDRNLDSRQLAEFTRDRISKGMSFKFVIAEVKRWGQRQ